MGASVGVALDDEGGGFAGLILQVDDAYLAPPARAPLVLAGGGRRIELALGSGYRFAQVYAPSDDDVVALEPMTAPTNALFSDGPDLVWVRPGERFAASFTITISDLSG